MSATPRPWRLEHDAMMRHILGADDTSLMGDDDGSLDLTLVVVNLTLNSEQAFREPETFIPKSSWAPSGQVQE